MAGKAAATVGSMHVCPLLTGPVPHVGGPISGPGVPTVLIDGQAAAVVGDMCVCCGPPDAIIQGAAGVLIDGKPLALMGSMTAHAGQITQGIPTVMVGPADPPSPSQSIADIQANELLELGEATYTETEINSLDIEEAVPPMFTGCVDNPLVEDNGEGTEESVEYTLTSEFAHEQILLRADALSETNFMKIVMPIFGSDIGMKAYSRLYKDLSDRKIVPPKIKVVKNAIAGHQAAYNNNERLIYVSERFIDKAIEDRYQCALLLSALVEEFGHHLDNILRNDYSNVKGDAKYDEGTRYAYNLFFINPLEEPRCHFADVTSPDFSGPLQLDLSDVHAEMRKALSLKEQQDDCKNADGEWEFFGAGRVTNVYKDSFGHQDIADALSGRRNSNERIFNEEEVDKIYFGNWLRDMSQAILGASLRLAKEQQKLLKKNPKYKGKISEILEAQTNKLDREGITKLVEILAVKEFIYQPMKESGIKIATEEFEYYRKKLHKNFKPVTPELLGVYRPEEHIDNPLELVDETAYDEGLFVGYLKEQLNIDPKTGLKNFIVKDFGEDRPSAVSYMKAQFIQAAKACRTMDGFIHFGAALHVLEDYFSHSNFVEITLIKLGFVSVHPWIEDYPTIKTTFRQKSPVVGPPYSCEAVFKVCDEIKKIKISEQAAYLPVVTGMFGLGDDALASLGPKIGDLTFPKEKAVYQLRKAGERTFFDAAILTILENIIKGQAEDGNKGEVSWLGSESKAEIYLKVYKNYLAWLDAKAGYMEDDGKEYNMDDFLRWHDRTMHNTMEEIKHPVNFCINVLTNSSNEVIAELETHTYRKHYGTDPTHTQLAKDDPMHPLNPLAGMLAVKAVLDAGRSLLRCWSGLLDPECFADNIANTYFVHPCKTSWMDQIVYEWAEKNPAAIERCTSATVFEHVHKKTQPVIEEGDRIVDRILDYFQQEKKK